MNQSAPIDKSIGCKTVGKKLHHSLLSSVDVARRRCEAVEDPTRQDLLQSPIEHPRSQLGIEAGSQLRGQKTGTKPQQ